ncbi:MAG: outer membrane protein assembly factor BamC [Gammaproteobacteria bacterium]|nr:outer membrane protein assembly factor BamC [Gammaproteobacteria bacterium]MCP5135764.1 outer membrane protein assembly factor BamC [Gammaproteobacteria bacterium]
MVGGDDGVIRDRELDYKQASSAPPLEIPPDLSSANVSDTMVIPAETAPVGGSTTYSQYVGQRNQVGGVSRATVLPAQDNIEVRRDGDKRWLVIKGSPDEVWPKMRDFWVENGWLIKTENPAIGILETDWAENRADIAQGMVRDFLKGVLDSLYSASTRDKYRVRLEPGEQPGTTELFLAHRGIEEVSQGEQFVWQERPADPELEAAMLRRMMLYFGVDEQRVESQIASAKPRAARAALIRDEGQAPSLLVDERFNRTWQLTGLALDRVGFTVEDRDRDAGVYYVVYDDPLAGVEKKGFFSKLKFWGDDKPKETEYRIKLATEGERTRVTVLDKSGALDTSDTGSRILALMYEQLK